MYTDRARKELLEFYNSYCREKLAIIAIRPCYYFRKTKFLGGTFERSQRTRKYALFFMPRIVVANLLLATTKLR